MPESDLHVSVCVMCRVQRHVGGGSMEGPKVRRGIHRGLGCIGQCPIGTPPYAQLRATTRAHIRDGPDANKQHVLERPLVRGPQAGPTSHGDMTNHDQHTAQRWDGQCVTKSSHIMSGARRARRVGGIPAQGRKTKVVESFIKYMIPLM